MGTAPGLYTIRIKGRLGATALLAPRILDESRAEGVRSGYDLEGATAITLGTMALVFTLIKANDWGWGSARTLAGLAVAAGPLVGFVWIERRHDKPLVPLRIFANRSLTLIGSSALASLVVDRLTPKPVLVAGLLIATVGFALFTRVQARGDYAGHVLPAMVVMGVGLGMSFVPITIAATSGVAAEDSGLASRLLNMTQQVGGSLGLAGLSAVSTSRITSALDGGSTPPAALTHGSPERSPCPRSCAQPPRSWPCGEP